ncbi:M43 family zinc metalloprotease, partial [Arthrospira platensis SPKY1]|nr:M43 family zinc metalloprotease [Arthrospira platensis SPKY1]
MLNIFLMPHHPDSVASPTYKPHFGGIALRNAVKVTGWYENGVSEWSVRYVLNHEIGHILSLMHTWAYNDGCDDTPHHPKCWNFTDEPPCDSLVSNNVMDYNAYQSAWSPCQIGKIHYTLSQETKNCRR